MKITHLPQSDILSDASFNCRGDIAPIEVRDLVEDIKKNGLLQPIVVQENKDNSDFNYKIIAGHRRFMALTLINDDPIPCIIRGEGEEEISEQKAKVLNLVENLKRKDLNILQEAKAIEKLTKSDLTNQQIADSLGVSAGWVQTRRNLLVLPEDIQQEAAIGTLTQSQIQQLYSLRAYRDRLYEVYGAMKDGRKAGKTVTISKIRDKSLYTATKRKSNEMIKMIEFVGQTKIGFGLHTRFLAWAAGTVSTYDLFQDLQQYCEDNDLRVPQFPGRF